MSLCLNHLLCWYSHISFDKTNLPEGYKVKLIDIENNNSSDTPYTYNSETKNIKKFKVIVERPLVEIKEDSPLSLEYTYTYPNPYKGASHPQTKARGQKGITFRYKTSGSVQKVTIEVYNLAGKLVDRFEGELTGETNWSFADNLANGVYIYRITVSDGKNTKSKTGKMVVIK